MSTENLLRNITVASPCLADWGLMTGDERIRFCDHVIRLLRAQGAMEMLAKAKEEH